MKEERFSSGTPSKNKISNFGAIFLYTQILYTTLSLSLNLKKNKSRKDIYIRGLPNYYMFWHFESVYNCSKGIHVFLCYHVVYVVTSCFPFSFYSPYVILLRIVLLIPLKYHTGNWSCRLLQYNIITTKTYRSIFFHYLGEGSESGLVGVWIVWNLEPLASGGQSGPKLVPHIICQFLYDWEKNSERGLMI